MDVISNLPVEIALKIFGNLSAEDLARCSLVSRRWYCLTNLDSLWKRFSVDDECSVFPKSKESEKVCLHKAWYARRASSIKKWVDRSYWIHYCRPKSCYALMGNGAIFVEAYGNRICISDLNEGKSDLLSIVPVTAPGLSFDQSCPVWFSETVLVMQIKWSGLLCVYKWENGTLIFIDVVYGRYDDSGEVLLESFNVSGLPQNKATSIAKWNRILIEGDRLVMPQGKSKIYIWSLGSCECVTTLSDFPYGGFCNLFTNDGVIYICCHREMFLYNLCGDRKAIVHYDIQHVMIYDCFLFFNKTTILAAFSGEAPMHAAWDFELNVVAAPFDIEGVGVLHPSLPAVCFIQNVETEVLAKKFVAMHIQTKSILWQSDSFHCSRIFTKFVPHCNYVILSDKYMVYFCSTETNEPGCFRSWFVLDLEKGEIVTRCILPFKTQLRKPKYCGNKAVIFDTSDNNNMCFVFS